jgi:chromosomal replication initiation ATPase DnaA
MTSMNYIAIPGLKFRDCRAEDYRMNYIIDAVCAYYKKTIEEIQSTTRAMGIVEPRRVLMFLLREDACLGLKRIGLLFGQHHATVIHSCKMVRKDITAHPPTRSAIDAIRSLYP